MFIGLQVNDMTRLILIRHGQTDKNATDKIHRQHDQETINKTGIDQAKKTAQRLQKETVVKIYHSSEIRAIQTAQIIGRQLDLKLCPANDLHERDWGEYTDMPWTEIAKRLDKLNPETRYHFRPPGGETWREFETRLVKAVNQIINENPGRTIAVVTHGGAIRALIPALLEQPKQESFKYEPQNGSISIFNRLGRKFKAEVINNIDHLR